MSENNVKTVRGATAEGYAFEMTVYYPDGGAHDAMPERIVGTYGSRDGGGSFDVTRADDLPWVVSAGTW